MIANTVYILCTLMSIACAVLLLRGYRRSRTRVLLIASLAFGAFAINNFDTRNFTGTVKGAGVGYAGSLTSPGGFSGTAAGTFFGNIPGFPASETGGSFALKGPAYLAAGVFAGAR